jgi:hypothetical protein
MVGNETATPVTPVEPEKQPDGNPLPDMEDLPEIDDAPDLDELGELPDAGELPELEEDTALIEALGDPFADDP